MPPPQDVIYRIVPQDQTLEEDPLFQVFVWCGLSDSISKYFTLTRGFICYFGPASNYPNLVPGEMMCPAKT